MPIINKKLNKVEENNNIVDELEGDTSQTDSAFDETDFEVSEPVKRPIIIPRSKDRINKNNPIDDNSTLPRLVDFVPKSPQREMDTIARFLESETFKDDFAENDNDQDFNMDVYGSKWILSSHLSTIGEDEEESNGQEFSSNFG